MKPLHSALILISLVSSIYTVRFLSSTSEPSDPNQTTIESPIDDVATSAQELFCGAVYLTENFTEHQYNTASGIQNFVGGLRKGNSLLWYLQNNYSMNQIYHNYWKEILPYTALGLFLLVISIVMFCCFCFKARCCKPCLEADETKVTRWVTIGLIFSVLIVAASAIGIEASLNAKANFQAANCAAITLISEFSTGNQTKNWTGLANMVDNLTTVSQLYEPAVQGLPVVDTDSSSVDNAYAQLNTSIYQYWTNNSNITVTNPQRPTQQLTPTFIQNLGPINDDPTTYAGSLLQEAQSHYLLFSTSLEEAHASIQHLNDTVDTSQAAINNAIPYLTDFNQLIEVISLRYQHAGKIALTISQDLGDGLFGFFIFATTISVFTFLIVVNIILCQFTFFQRCFKFTYICLYLTLFICFVILIVGFPILIVLGEGCSVAQASLTDAGTFQSAMNTFFRNYSRVTTYTNTCFFDDGDIPTTYGIASPLIQFNSLYQTIVTVNETVLETPNSLILPGQQQMIRSIKFYDVSTNTEIDNALTEFNKFTNYQTSETYQISCRVSQDTWYLNETNCTAANGVEFDGSDASFNFPNATCLGFSNFGSLNYSDRYKAASFSGCGQVSGEDFVDYITQFAGNFTTYINDVKSGFAQMSGSFSIVNQNNVHFMNAGMNLMDSISGINGSSLTVTQIIGDPIGGIYPNSNCKSAHDNAEAFVDNFCVGYLPSVGLIMLLALLYAIFGMVLLYPLITMDKLEKKRAEQKKKYDESLVRLGELY